MSLRTSPRSSSGFGRDAHIFADDEFEVIRISSGFLRPWSDAVHRRTQLVGPAHMTGVSRRRRSATRFIRARREGRHVDRRVAASWHRFRSMVEAGILKSRRRLDDVVGPGGVS